MLALLPSLHHHPPALALALPGQDLLLFDDSGTWARHRLREVLAEAWLWGAECIQGPRGVSHTWKTRMESKLTGREEEGCSETTFSDRNPLHPLS